MDLIEIESTNQQGIMISEVYQQYLYEKLQGSNHSIQTIVETLSVSFSYLSDGCSSFVHIRVETAS